MCSWLEGDNPEPDSLADPHQLARDLAHFIQALRAIEATDAPRPSRHNFGRGVPLAHRDAQVQTALAALHGTIDVESATRSWEADRDPPAWSGPALWIHGDLNAGNLLVWQGRLSGVIDFGGLAAGDPACDLLAAWYLFDPGARETFRSALGADDASWARGRGRGWALSMALIALSYYKETNLVIAANALRALGAVLADRRGST